MDDKQCSKCKQVKPLNLFGTRVNPANSKTYYQSWCKNCTRLYVKGHYRARTVHDRLIKDLYSYIAQDPEDNAQYLITQIKCALITAGYSDSEAVAIIRDK